MARQRTHIEIPDPKGSEFENFDRLAGILMRAKPVVKKKAAITKRKKAVKPKD